MPSATIVKHSNLRQTVILPSSAFREHQLQPLISKHFPAVRWLTFRFTVLNFRRSVNLVWWRRISHRFLLRLHMFTYITTWYYHLLCSLKHPSSYPVFPYAIDTVSFIVWWNGPGVSQICVSKLNIVDSDNGLSPGRHQAIIWTNAEILSIRNLRTNLTEILCEIHAFSFKSCISKCRLWNGNVAWMY